MSFLIVSLNDMFEIIRNKSPEKNEALLRVRKMGKSKLAVMFK